ncbi:DUF982 domain-containing protein [Mesorhizobium waimense]|uniref:DUF982 domain-containing protein n=1 Tax=Mesorhizobium waimense TaxID=1300307 RepID=A0A3A5JXY7_9HYPH|nr:DUF982 domain-containing protein [Mesorhizobium waimense]RJT27881.1 DUF982 domain-containing protein [Mesorhizobium waimense]
MRDIRFPEPVRLRVKPASERIVASSWEAIECLHDQWPEWARGPSYRAACRTCRDSLDGWRAPQQARRVFLKAARCASWSRPPTTASPRRLNMFAPE